MAKGRKAKVKPIVKPIIEEPKKTAWTVDVKVKKGLITPYRISGKVDDIISVPADVVDELVRLKKVERI
jgi:hypothetical protein